MIFYAHSVGSYPSLSLNLSISFFFLSFFKFCPSFSFFLFNCLPSLFPFLFSLSYSPFSFSHSLSVFPFSFSLSLIFSFSFSLSLIFSFSLLVSFSFFPFFLFLCLWQRVNNSQTKFMPLKFTFLVTSSDKPGYQQL